MLIRWPSRIAALLCYGVAAAAAACPLMSLAPTSFRAAYPSAWEWRAGGTLEHVRRIRVSEPRCVASSLDFVPIIYAIVCHYYDCAASVRARQLFGLGVVLLTIIDGPVRPQLLYLRREDAAP